MKWETVLGEEPSLEDFGPDDYAPYEVHCARCGKAGLCTDYHVEEGDEWECPECFERCEAQERAQFKSALSKE
jgi:hypothetical protein